MKNNFLKEFKLLLKTLHKNVEEFYQSQVDSNIPTEYIEDLSSILEDVSKSIEILSTFEEEKIEKQNEWFLYENEYLKDLCEEEILNYSVALIQSKNIIRSIYDLIGG